MAAVRRLRAACEAFGGQDLKVTPRESDPGPVPLQFVAREGREVVGYCSVDIVEDAEICGMVHPVQRSRGIGNALLDAALAATGAIGKDSALVICEDAHPGAIEWLRHHGAELESSELRMVLRLAAGVPRAPRAVELRPATDTDRPLLHRLLDDGFPGTDTRVLEAMIDRVQAGGDESFVGWRGNQAVGTLRLFHTPNRSMVYGLVVDRELRGHGHGRAMMMAALDILRERSIAEVSLEVLPDNEAAVGLYRSLGFKTVTTYRYMRVESIKSRELQVPPHRQEK